MWISNNSSISASLVDLRVGREGSFFMPLEQVLEVRPVQVSCTKCDEESRHPDKRNHICEFQPLRFLPLRRTCGLFSWPRMPNFRFLTCLFREKNLGVTYDPKIELARTTYVWSSWNLSQTSYIIFLVPHAKFQLPDVFSSSENPVWQMTLKPN